MSELYGRRYQLMVTARGIRRAWDALDITFSIAKTSSSEPNKAAISVWNLTPDSQALLQSDDAVVTLSAGYAGSVGVIFSGDVDEALLAREGTDRILKVEASDGGRSLRSSIVNISAGNDARRASLVSDVLSSLGLATGSVAELPGALKQGLSFVGPASRVLDALVGDAGHVWSVQDGAVQIHPATGTQQSIVVLSPDTGLVGSPEAVAQQNQLAGASQRGVKVLALLQAGINPGRRIRLVAESLSGDYVVQRVTHRGSTFGPDWYTEIEAY